METTQSKTAKNLTTGDTFLRWNRRYTVIANEKGSGGRGRSIIASAQSGEQVAITLPANETVEVQS